jgi:glycerate 2-kinase
LYRDGVDDPRTLLRAAFRAAVAAADPEEAISAHLPDPPDGRVVVVGAGKAAAAMAAAVEGRYLDAGATVEGVVVTRYGHSGPTRAVRVLEAAHPVPDQAGIRASEAILDAVRRAGADDLVIVVVSGGGSALLCAPVEGLDLADKQAVTEALLRSGAEIGEINTVRRHLSRVKGGRLAAAAAPAPLLALVVSDVVGDDLAAIASGPTVPDPTRFEDALAVLARHRVEVPAVTAVLERGRAGELPETPKPGDPRLERARSVLVATNQRSLDAAAAVLRDAGLAVAVLSSSVTGEARTVASVHAAIARQAWKYGQPLRPPCAFVSGGETTVTVRGAGRGGRNSEFALGLALALPEDAPVAVLAADSDGIDGVEDHAGAFVTPALLRSLDRVRAAEALDDNDSYRVFADADHLLVTGPTRTNVNDVRLVLVLGAEAA